MDALLAGITSVKVIKFGDNIGQSCLGARKGKIALAKLWRNSPTKIINCHKINVASIPCTRVLHLPDEVLIAITIQLILNCWIPKGPVNYPTGFRIGSSTTYTSSNA